MLHTSSRAAHNGAHKLNRLFSRRTYTTEAQALARYESKPFFSIAQGQAAQRAYYALLRSRAWGKLADHHIHALQHEETRITQEFLERIGCSARMWQKNLKKADQRLSQEYEHPEFSTSLNATAHITDHHRTTIDRVLDACCMEPSLIYAVASKRLEACAQIIFTDTATDAENGYAHEAMHIMHNDSTYNHARELCYAQCIPFPHNKRYAARELFHDKLICLQKPFRLFNERRADILSSLRDPNWALLNSCMFSCLVDHELHCGPDQTHPPSPERAKYCKDLYDAMIQEQKGQVV